MTQRTLLVGIDAGDFRTLDRLLSAGKLSNFKDVIQDGFRGELESSIPPWTPTAWTSLTTGKNPGKHGVFDFKSSTNGEIIGYNDIRTNHIWDYLDEHKESAIIVNVPVTHPPPKINGVVIPGYLAPPATEIEGRPKGIVEEIEAEVGTYRVYVSGEATDDEELCNEYLDLMEMRAETMIYLCSNYEWSFGMVQFQRTDTVFHELPEKQYIDEVYKKLDDCLGRLLSALSPDNVMLVSDHGMGKTGDWDIRVNSWLEANGYLETAKDGLQTGWQKPKQSNESSKDKGLISDPIGTAAGTAAKVGLTPRKMQAALDRVGLRQLVESALPDSVIKNIAEKAGEGIDIENSTAYCPSGPSLGIVCDDEVKPKLVAELEDLCDPDGDPVFEWVRPAETVHQGPATDLGPDVIAFPNGMEYYVSATLTAEIFAESRYRYNHMPEGIVIGSGEAFKSEEENQQVSIHDIAPTVLTLLDIPLDPQFDGKVIESVLADPSLPGTMEYHEVEAGDTLESSDAVESRLEDLGYL